MTALFAIILRELRSQVVAPIAWLVWTLFLLAAGWFFFGLVTDYAVILGNYQVYSQILQDPSLIDRVNLNEIVVATLLGNILVLFLFLIPILTMRSFAEERRQGTDELLLTAPVTPGGIVAGKYLGLLPICWAMVAGVGIFVAVLRLYGNPEMGPVVTGLLGLALGSAGLASLGLALSTLTESPIIAAVSAFVLNLMLLVVGRFAESREGWLGRFLAGIAVPTHFENFAKGLVTSTDVLYFLSLTALGLFVARAAIASQRWR